MEDPTEPNTIQAPTGNPPSPVYVIQSTFHYRDADHRPVTDEQVLVDEGWFEDVESATVRRDQLNAQNRRLYDVDMERARRDREAKIAAATRTNAEVAVLRQNGFDRQFVDVPAGFEPVPFEDYRPDRSFTTYEVVAIHRSELDGIASAAGATKD